MVRLTVELIEEAPQFINTIRDRELSLRGYKIPAIENMGVTNDQFDVIDFTDNDIKRLDNFPILKRVHTLYFHNNRIQVIQQDLAEKLPNLRTIALTNNNLCELGDIDALAGCKKLEYVTFLGNPICHKQNYREYVIYKLPSVRVIDFKRVKLAEREAARRLYKGKKGKRALESVGRTNLDSVFEDKENGTTHRPGRAITDAERAKIKEAIQSAKSLQEAEYLGQILASGRVPEKGWNKALDLVQEDSARKENEFVPETESMDTD